ncbi:MAG: ribbon-helix-helix domain-containing protein [Kiritimatiellae bacterium]|nr:ribbon-helix-helix domain-containing protein [Kiritimatiellia bacterium]
MSTAKVAITIDEGLLSQLDMLVKKKVFANRSKAIQEAVAEKLERINNYRLARECSKLDVEVEQSVAEAGMGYEVHEWPEY